MILLWLFSWNLQITLPSKKPYMLEIDPLLITWTVSTLGLENYIHCLLKDGSDKVWKTISTALQNSSSNIWISSNLFAVSLLSFKVQRIYFFLVVTAHLISSGWISMCFHSSLSKSTGCSFPRAVSEYLISTGRISINVFTAIVNPFRRTASTSYCGSSEEMKKIALLTHWSERLYLLLHDKTTITCKELYSLLTK